MKENKNLYPKLVSKVTSHFIWVHLSRKQAMNSNIVFVCQGHLAENENLREWIAYENILRELSTDI